LVFRNNLLSTIFYLLHEYLNRKSLYKNSIILQAFVYQINQGTHIKGSSETVIMYSFYYKGEKYIDGIDTDISYRVKGKLLNTYFPVLIDTTKPSNNILLVDLKRWDAIGRKFPDSLNWIKNITLNHISNNKFYGLICVPRII